MFKMKCNKDKRQEERLIVVSHLAIEDIFHFFYRINYSNSAAFVPHFPSPKYTTAF